jgi:hypothetical protein
MDRPVSKPVLTGWAHFLGVCLLACLQGVSNIAWALATAGHRDEALFEKLLSHCMADISSYDVQVRVELQGIVSACNLLDSDYLQAEFPAGAQPSGPSAHHQAHICCRGCSPDSYRRLLHPCIMLTCPRYCCLPVVPQGLSNLLWACATLGHKDPTFLAAATHECGTRVERMSSQNLSNVLWACATLGHADGRLLSSWAEAVMHKLDMFESQVGCWRQGPSATRRLHVGARGFRIGQHLHLLSHLVLI